MPSDVVVLPIAPASDGTNAGPVSRTDMRAADIYFCEKLAERWMKDTKRAQPGLSYRLESLPAGYHGFERSREATKHIDRYVYGHPNGVFRSLNEIYPHFKHLQTYGRAAGCSCKLCLKKSSSVSVSSSSSGNRAAAKPASTKTKTKIKPAMTVESSDSLPHGRLPSNSESSSSSRIGPRNKQVDEEGTPDGIRALLDKLEEAGDAGVNEAFVDQLSPDWRVGQSLLQGLLTEWQGQPKFVPRIGEIVLFTRYAGSIAWDAPSQTFNGTTGRSLSKPLKWEAGVVTQTPIEAVSREDLHAIPEHKKQNVAYSGFRVEPMSEIGNEYKPFTSQHKYIPLHSIRPFSFWKECVDGEKDLHPTIKHALAVASSFCILGKYNFKGVWPEATLFASSIYLGSELIMLGDVVKLAPLESRSNVTDVMLITSIRLRFVNIDRASNDDYDNGLPYTTVLHIGGKSFTLDAKRSFTGIGKAPAKPGQHGLPEGLGVYGQWFHMINPFHEKGRLEVPFHRILGRCYDEIAMKAWFSSPEYAKGKQLDLSQDLRGYREARAYSSQYDSRIKAGKAWFWGDTRTEQLDLHEINGKFVGVKDETRSPKQVNAWRQALKVMDGKKGGVEQWYAAREKRVEEEKRREQANVPSGAWGMMAAGGKGDSGTDVEKLGGDAMEVDDDMAEHEEHAHREIIDLVDEDDTGDDDDDDDNDDEATDHN